MFENMQLMNQSQSQLLNRQKNINIDELKQQYQLINSSNNPQAMFNNITNKNAQLKNIVDKVKALYNGDAKAMFYAEARTHGLNDDQINAFVNNFRQTIT